LSENIELEQTDLKLKIKITDKNFKFQSQKREIEHLKSTIKSLNKELEQAKSENADSHQKIMNLENEIKMSELFIDYKTYIYLTTLTFRNLHLASSLYSELDNLLGMGKYLACV